MKKVFAGLLAAAMVMSLAACGSKPGEKEAEASAEPVDAVVIDGQELGMGLVLGEAEAEEDSDPDREIDRAVTPIKPCFASALDGTPLTEEFYFYRSTLDEPYKQAYDLLRAGMLEGKESITMTVPVPKSDIFDIYKMVIYDSPELFWAETNGSKYRYNRSGVVTSFSPGYNELAEDIAGNTARFEAALYDALADMWSLEGEAQKAKYAHDYLTHTVSYELEAEHNQTAFSAAVNGSSVCAGYAHAFQYMMQKMGIPCAYMLGGVNGGYHAWNQLELEGEFYAMDVTWDDPIGAAPDKYSYKYFNITEDAIGKTHSRMEVSHHIPEATGTRCSYENAFAGVEYGTDFEAIKGVMPERAEEEKAGNPYLG